MKSTCQNFWRAAQFNASALMNQKAQDIAKNMLAMGLSAEQVAKATQLSLEIIKNLSNS